MISECKDGILLLIPQGEVAKIETPTVQEIVTMLRSTPIKRVIFDLSQTEIITSPGFGWMFGIARECKKLGVAIFACAANSVVSRSLKWVNGNLVMSIVATREEAQA